MTTDAVIGRILAADAVSFGEFELSHGGTSDYYVDTYRFETDPACLTAIAAAFADRIDTATPAGVAVGAVPLVVATGLQLDRPYVIVRKQRKEHGTGNRIEGSLPATTPVVVLEDVTTTGQSALGAVTALRDAGVTVDRVLVVINRQEGATALLGDHGVTLEALVTPRNS